MLRTIFNSELYNTNNDKLLSDGFLTENSKEPIINKPSVQIDTTFDTYFEDHEIIEITNATVCMIDICGFSKWCSNQIPHKIVHVMSDYNLHLSKLIDKYQGLTKIELVGDCCMVVGGLTDVMTKNESTLETIRFAVDLLQALNDIHNIFTDRAIGLRIGIHISNVFGVMMSNPRRFQLYGNDINVCSRLESAAIKNTIHISLKTIMATQGLCTAICGPCACCIRSTMLNNEYKGVGHQPSFMFHVKRFEILWFHQVNIKLKRILKHFKDFKNISIIDDPSFIEIYSFFWDHVIIFVETTDYLNEIVRELSAFRKWEKKRMSQNITIVLDCSLNHTDLEELCNVHRIEKHQLLDESFVEQLKSNIRSSKNIDASRSSLDLSICT